MFYSFIHALDEIYFEEHTSNITCPSIHDGPISTTIVPYDTPNYHTTMFSIPLSSCAKSKTQKTSGTPMLSLKQHILISTVTNRFFSPILDVQCKLHCYRWPTVHSSCLISMQVNLNGS